MNDAGVCPFTHGSEPATAGELDFVREAFAAVGCSRHQAEARIVALAAWRRDRPLPLSSDELAWAGRVAWRNHARCIGRLYWRTLQVRDRRGLDSADQVLDELEQHLALAFNGGQVRPLLTVFAPADGGRRIRIWNQQICGYAGYRERDGTVLGDPKNVLMTERALELGWAPPRTRGPFDLLPLVVTGADGGTRLRMLPPGLAREVALGHPEHPWLAALGLRWYAVPAVCDMTFRVAGTDYPAAPFNGWYMGTEIGARNLSDRQRYDLLPRIAAGLGLDTSRDDTLWRDRALVELNRAVLHSFGQAGVKIVDHHTAAEEFMVFSRREDAAGRHLSARWDWIVPPMSGSTTPVFHTPMQEFPATPNFFAPAG